MSVKNSIKKIVVKKELTASKTENSYEDTEDFDTIDEDRGKGSIPIDKLLEPYVVVLKDFKPLGDTPFRLNAFNGVYAPAKTGKTYFVLEQLNKLDNELYHIVWLDGDRNAELKDTFKNIEHYPITNTSEALKELIKSDYQYNDYIFVIDSFKDFTFGLDTDGNSSCQNIFMYYQKLLDKGATLIIIFHATKYRENGKVQGFKIKGNEDTIESKMDFLYKFERTEEYQKLTTQCARDINLKIGQELLFYDESMLLSKIEAVVNSKPEITLRDLKRESGLTQYAKEIDKLEGILFTIAEKKQDGRGKPKKIVKLI